MPRAVIAQELGPVENYKLEEIDPGQPGPGEARVAIRAAGVSYVDVFTAMGEYQVKPPVPFIPGSEFAGVVETVGEGVSNIAPGDKVYGSSFGKLFATSAVLNARNLSKVPEGVSFETAATFPVSYQTAFHALIDRARIQPGEALLVLGAAGATGFAAVQLGKHLGARVIASASSAAKQQVAREAGADAVVTTGADDWREQVKAANGGKAIDVVFDPVGGEATEPAFRSLGYGGRHLLIGFPAGPTTIRTNLILIKSAELIGVQLRHFSVERAEQAYANNRKLQELVAQGIVSPAIARTYRLEDYAAAMTDAFSGKSAGRVVLTMDAHG
jgi:NADPH:quinone reductase